MKFFTVNDNYTLDDIFLLKLSTLSNSSWWKEIKIFKVIRFCTTNLHWTIKLKNYIKVYIKESIYTISFQKINKIIYTFRTSFLFHHFGYLIKLLLFEHDDRSFPFFFFNKMKNLVGKTKTKKGRTGGGRGVNAQQRDTQNQPLVRRDN